MKEIPSVLPPQNIEAEKELLGGILFDPPMLKAARAIVREKDFYRKNHSLIFKAMKSAVDNGDGSLDHIILISELRRSGDLDAAGGIKYVTTLTDEISTSRRVQAHAKLVVEAAHARSVIMGLDAGLQRARNFDEDPDVILADLRAMLSEIALEHALDSQKPEPVDSAYENLGPDPQPLVETLLSPGTCGFIGADAGGGKTTTSDSLAISLASGHLAFGKFSIPSPRNVLLIQVEDPRRRHLKRLNRLAIGMGLEKLPPNIFRWQGRKFFLDDPRDIATMEAFIREKDIGLVIADPFVYIHNLDENSNQDMAKLLLPIKVLFEELKCCLAIIHHNKHMDPNFRGPMELGRLRGASFLLGWRDFYFVLSPRGPQVLTKIINKDLGNQQFYLQLVKTDNGGERIEWREYESQSQRADFSKDVLYQAIVELAPSYSQTGGRIPLVAARKRAGIPVASTALRRAKSLATEGLIELFQGGPFKAAFVRLMSQRERDPFQPILDEYESSGISQDDTEEAF